MLSNSAFNALLKTLEEPPAHVKFIFATTEIRKVPVTVLSRCQRFDLRRIEPEVMIAHLQAIAAREGAEIAEDALALITRAAEGSVRDAMSLMDQAISHGAGETTAEQVRAMLGLADHGRIMDLFEKVMSGDAAGALDELGAQYADGADPMAVLRDLAELTHWLSVINITPEAADDPTIGPDERTRGRALAETLSMRVLARTWQMLLKALEEVALAPNAMMAAEMALIRLTHVADLPPPEDLVRRLKDATPPPAPGPAPRARMGGSQAARPRRHTRPQRAAAGHGTAPRHRTPRWPRPRIPRSPITPASTASWRSSNRTATSSCWWRSRPACALSPTAPAASLFSPTERAPRDLAPRLAQSLKNWTGVRWTVSWRARAAARPSTRPRPPTPARWRKRR